MRKFRPASWSWIVDGKPISRRDLISEWNENPMSLPPFSWIDGVGVVRNKNRIKGQPILTLKELIAKAHS